MRSMDGNWEVDMMDRLTQSNDEMERRDGGSCRWSRVLFLTAVAMPPLSCGSCASAGRRGMAPARESGGMAAALKKGRRAGGVVMQEATPPGSACGGTTPLEGGSKMAWGRVLESRAGMMWRAVL